MNLFILDNNPAIAARFACDRHVIKGVLESSQLICGVFHLQGHAAPYKLTHKNHPVAIWSRTSRANFDWAVTHGLALCNEYTKRYGKIHKSQAVVEWARDNINILSFPESELTPFAQAMPEQYKNPCAVTAYRNYYIGDKYYFATWRNQQPYWFSFDKVAENLEQYL